MGREQRPEPRMWWSEARAGDKSRAPGTPRDGGGGRQGSDIQRRLHTAPLERITAMLPELRDKTYSSEAEVDARLIRPLLVALGWDVNQENTEVWMRLTEEMARLWSYPSGQMRRDYVLPGKTEAVLHIEAKHRWCTPARDIEALLEQISRDDWHATLKDGWQKDLALLL